MKFHNNPDNFLLKNGTLHGKPIELIKGVHVSIKVNHNACSLHLATHFQTQISHMGMFYMVY